MDVFGGEVAGAVGHDRRAPRLHELAATRPGHAHELYPSARHGIAVEHDATHQRGGGELADVVLVSEF